MKNELNQQLPIYYNGKLCKFIDWDSLDFLGYVKIQVTSKRFIKVSLNNLNN